jgi:hypothetical protein
VGKGYKVGIADDTPAAFPMDDDKYQELFDLLGDITGEKGTWDEKRARLLGKANGMGRDVKNLSEFLSWFGGELPQ